MNHTNDQIVQGQMNLGTLTKSLCKNLHQNYADTLINFRSTNYDGVEEDISDHYIRKKKLCQWIKDTIGVINEFKMLLRVPYDKNLYAIIDTLQEKMHSRREKILSISAELKEYTIILNDLISPLHKVEQALEIATEGKHRIEKYKTDAILIMKKDDPEIEGLKKVIEESDNDQKEIPKTYIGYFERHGFCIGKYFHTHYYLAEKLVCQIGKIAEVELFYSSRENVKFHVLKISLLKSFDFFNLSENERVKTHLKDQLHNLAIGINNKLHEKYNISVRDIIDETFPKEIKEFEMFEHHEQEHIQLSEIQLRIRKFLKVVLLQVINDKFNEKIMVDSKFGRANALLEADLKLREGFIKGLCLFDIPHFKNRVKFAYNKNATTKNNLKFI